METHNKDCLDISQPCWIPQAHDIVHENIIQSLRQCDTIQKYRCMMTSIQKAKDKAHENCNKLCKTESYHVMDTYNRIEPFPKVIIITISLQNSYPKNSWSIFQKGKMWRTYIVTYYQSFTETLYTETEVYDFNAVVASVGGSLGLFLGFSCYQYGKNLIEILPF